jgi:hypothetical protein
MNHKGGIRFTLHTQRNYWSLMSGIKCLLDILDEYEIPDSEDKRLFWEIKSRHKRIKHKEVEVIRKDEEWTKNAK